LQNSIPNTTIPIFKKISFKVDQLMSTRNLTHRTIYNNRNNNKDNFTDTIPFSTQLPCTKIQEPSKTQENLAQIKPSNRHQEAG